METHRTSPVLVGPCRRERAIRRLEDVLWVATHTRPWSWANRMSGIYYSSRWCCSPVLHGPDSRYLHRWDWAGNMACIRCGSPSEWRLDKRGSIKPLRWWER